MALNIIVLIKQIIDIDQIRPDPNTGEPMTQGIPYKVETLSKNAIEAAVQLKEKNGGKVTGIIFGTEKASAAMKEAYAMGVDEGIILTGYAGNNPLLTAHVISEKIKSISGYNVIILGNQSADSYTGVLSGMIAGKLSIPLLGNAVSIEAEDGKMKIRRALEDKDQIVSAPTPCIVSVTQEINQPRLPPVLQVMAAGKKPINTEQAALVDIQNGKVLSNLAPKSERRRQIFEDVEKGSEEIAKIMRGEIK